MVYRFFGCRSRRFFRGDLGGYSFFLGFVVELVGVFWKVIEVQLEVVFFVIFVFVSFIVMYLEDLFISQEAWDRGIYREGGYGFFGGFFCRQLVFVVQEFGEGFQVFGVFVVNYLRGDRRIWRIYLFCFIFGVFFQVVFFKVVFYFSGIGQFEEFLD